jgi:tetratricopeptide (TPR) repeat protein
MDQGRAAMDAQRFDEALELFGEVIERDPNYAEGWNRRATLHYLTGRFEKSLADINKVLALEPRHFGALSGRGLVLTQLDRLHDAIEAFRAALEVNPHMQSARVNIEHLREVLEKREI